MSLFSLSLIQNVTNIFYILCFEFITAKCQSTIKQTRTMNKVTVGNVNEGQTDKKEME